MAPPDPPNSPFHTPAYLNAGRDLLTWMLMRRRRIAKTFASPYAPGPSTPGPWAPTGAGSSSDAEPEASPADPPATPDDPLFRGLLNIGAPPSPPVPAFRGLLNSPFAPPNPGQGSIAADEGDLLPAPGLLGLFTNLLGRGTEPAVPPLEPGLPPGALSHTDFGSQSGDLMPDFQRAADEAGGQTAAGPPEAPEVPEFRGLLSQFGRGLLNVGIGGLNPSPLLPDIQRAADEENGQTGDAAAMPPSKQYQQGGLGLGSDWRNQFSAVASGNLSSLLDGQAAETLYPQRGQPLFTPPPSVGEELPEFHRPLLLLPDMLQLAAAENTEGINPKDVEPASASDKIFSAVWPYLVQREGGYSNTKTDSGGKTMHGISQSFVDAHNLQIKDVHNIVEEQAHNIVKKRIYYGRNIDLLPPELQPQVLDASLPAEYTGIKTLQQVLKDMGAKDNGGHPPEADGGVGNKTLEAIDSLPPARMRELRDRYAEALSEGYGKIVKKNKSQEKFLPGWLARTEFFRTFELPK